MVRTTFFFAIWLSALVAVDSPAPLARDTLPREISFDPVPVGLDPLSIPRTDPRFKIRVELGRKLFFDPVLSGNNTVACASCHRPDTGFASAGGRPRGIHGQLLARRAPTLFNRAYGTQFFWDGRSSTLEEQALEPIANPKEMGSSVKDVLRRLKENPDYPSRFEAAFDDGITAANLASALASFERVLLRGDSPVDGFRAQGHRDGLTASQRHGFWLYESKGQCWRCHSGKNFTDEQFHNTGVGWGVEPLDPGRFAVTRKPEDRGKFKTPTLRGVVLTGPYMHDGSIATLQEVVEFYNKGGKDNPNRDPILKPLNLTPAEINDLVEFLKCL